jgi:hypothetical protein
MERVVVLLPEKQTCLSVTFNEWNIGEIPHINNSKTDSSYEKGSSSLLFSGRQNKALCGNGYNFDLLVCCIIYYKTIFNTSKLYWLYVWNF